VLRLLGFLATFLIGIGGFLAVDFAMSRQWAGKEDADGLTFSEYLGGLTGRMANLTGGSSASGLPRKLEDMLPKPPEGWTVRPAVAEDVNGFLPKKAKNLPEKARKYVQNVATAKAGKGTEITILTYEKGEQRVIIKAVRYPNFIFTSFMAMQQRFELQMIGPEYRGTQFMTVRGLDVVEDLLPDDVRARYFMANVGSQIHLRILASEKMRDKDLVPFFQTLHVKAMNASVIDKKEGLGDVPVIVLASVMDDITRKAYEADMAQREAEAAIRREEERAAAEAEAAKAAEAEKSGGGGLFGGLFGGDEEEAATEDAPSGTTGCKKGTGGSKRCTVAGETGE
jgi:hypothetical protein